MHWIFYYRSLRERNLISHMLIFIVLYVAQAPSHTSSLSLRAAYAHAPTTFYDDAGDYFATAEEHDPSPVSKRAPWAPSEIRYDTFVQKLLAGKTKLYGSRDKHSNSLHGSDDDEYFERFGRALQSEQPADEVDNRRHLENIYSTIKDLRDEIDAMCLSLYRHLTSSSPSSASSGREFSDRKKFGQIGDASSTAPGGSSIRPAQAEGNSRDLENVLIQVNDELRAMAAQYRISPKQDGTREGTREGTNDRKVIYDSGFYEQDSARTRSGMAVIGRRKNDRAGKADTTDTNDDDDDDVGSLFASLSTKKTNDDRRPETEKQQTARSRKRRYFGSSAQRAVDELLDPQIQEILEAAKRIHQYSENSGNTVKFIG